MTPEQQQALLDSAQPLWCVDPIDGTSNYSTGFPCFCVSLALIVDKNIVFGLVYDPIRDECFSAQQGCGAYLNDQLLSAEPTNLDLSETIALIDFKRLPNKMATQLVTDKPYSSQRSLGSIALELCWLSAGRGHIYLHAKQQLWDYAAAYVILNEVNAYASTLKGQSIFDGSLKPKSTIAASSKALYTQWFNYLNTIM
jgi:myo-inositol-1(or 4)-monophosphatase